MKKKVLALLSLVLLVSPSLACVGQQGAAQGQGGQTSIWSMLLTVLPLIFLFYWVFIRPEKKRKNEQKEMLSNLKKGDEILTIGGMFGKVVEVREDKLIVDFSDKVRIKMTIDSVARVILEEEEEGKEK